MRKGEMILQRNRDQINKGRFPYTFKNGEQVYIKNHESKSLDEKFLGPFKIVRRNRYGNRFLIERPEKFAWVSWTNLKPRREQGVVLQPEGY